MTVYAAATECPDVIARAGEPVGGFFRVSENTLLARGANRT